MYVEDVLWERIASMRASFEEKAGSRDVVSCLLVNIPSILPHSSLTCSSKHLYIVFQNPQHG